MGDDYTLFLEKEIERLRAVLAETPEWKQMEMFQRHLQEYRALNPGPGKPVITSVRPLTRDDVAKYGRDGSRASVIVRAAEEYLKGRKHRAQSSEIVEALQQAGISLPEEKASAFVSSYLSTSPLFDNVRGEGYGLVEWQQKKLELT